MQVVVMNPIIIISKHVRLTDLLMWKNYLYTILLHTGKFFVHINFTWISSELSLYMKFMCIFSCKFLMKYWFTWTSCEVNVKYTLTKFGCVGWRTISHYLLLMHIIVEQFFFFYITLFWSKHLCSIIMDILLLLVMILALNQAFWL